MEEIFKSIAEAVRNRTTTAVLGLYAFFWVAWHWQGFYTLLFTKEELIYEKFGLLKNEYLNQYFFGLSQGWVDFISGFTVPLILAFLFTWPLPQWVFIHAYRAEQKYKVRRRKIKLEEQGEITKKEQSLVKKEAELVKAQADLSTETKRASVIDPKIGWRQDFYKFSDSTKSKNFQLIIDSIYAHTGRIKVTDYRGQIEFQVPSNLLAIAHTNDLINIDNKNQRIELTDKGKYFVSLYTSR